MAKKQHSIVQPTTGQFQHVLYMMAHDDFRFGNNDPRFAGSYTTITGGTYTRKGGSFVGTNGHTYKVFSDWSARQVA